MNCVDVRYYNRRDDKLNSFHLVLINRSDIVPGDFDIEFNYDKIERETAGAGDGSGEAGNFFDIAGTAVNGALLDTGPNTLVSGRINSAVNGPVRVRGTQQHRG